MRRGPYGPDITPLTIAVTHLTDRILRVRVTDAAHARWEVPDLPVSSFVPPPPTSVRHIW